MGGYRRALPSGGERIRKFRSCATNVGVPRSQVPTDPLFFGFGFGFGFGLRHSHSLESLLFLDSIWACEPTQKKTRKITITTTIKKCKKGYMIRLGWVAGVNFVGSSGTCQFYNSVCVAYTAPHFHSDIQNRYSTPSRHLGIFPHTSRADFHIDMSGYNQSFAATQLECPPD